MSYETDDEAGGKIVVGLLLILVLLVIFFVGVELKTNQDAPSALELTKYLESKGYQYVSVQNKLRGNTGCFNNDEYSIPFTGYVGQQQVRGLICQREAGARTIRTLD